MTDDVKCTAVLLCWKRFTQLEQIADYLMTFPWIDEVIICNNNPDVAPFRKEGVTVINNSKDLGLWTRFTSAALAKNEYVMFHDDDLMVRDDSLEDMWEAFKKRPHVNHGAFGRRPTDEGDYVLKNSSAGKVEVLLTRCVFSTRNRAIRALEWINDFDKELGGSPQGNGEDILLSFTSDGMNVAHDCKVDELGGGDDNAIHRRPGHKQHRSNVVKWCRAKMGDLRNVG